MSTLDRAGSAYSLPVQLAISVFDIGYLPSRGSIFGLTFFKKSCMI